MDDESTDIGNSGHTEMNIVNSSTEDVASATNNNIGIPSADINK